MGAVWGTIIIRMNICAIDFLSFSAAAFLQPGVVGSGELGPENLQLACVEWFGCAGSACCGANGLKNEIANKDSKLAITNNETKTFIHGKGRDLCKDSIWCNAYKTSCLMYLATFSTNPVSSGKLKLTPRK